MPKIFEGAILFVVCVVFLGVMRSYRNMDACNIVEPMIMVGGEQRHGFMFPYYKLFYKGVYEHSGDECTVSRTTTEKHYDCIMYGIGECGDIEIWKETD